MRLVVLHGSEGYLVRERTKLLVEALEKQFGGLEQFSFDGASVELAAVLDELRSYGLMQRHKLVILDNADEFLSERDGANRPPMENYAAHPVPEATLLMRAEGWRPGNLDKAIVKSGGTIIKCEPVSEQKAVTWAIGRCGKRYECQIEEPAARRLVDRAGPDLGRIDSELAKMAAFVGPGQNITLEVVNLMIQPTREEKAWEIQRPLAEGSPRAAVELLAELLEVSRVEPTVVNWAIGDLLRKVHLAAYFIRRGESAQSAARQARFFGDAYDAMCRAASRVEPASLAQLLQLTIESDWRTKTGQVDPRRSLEALTITVADTMG